MAEVATSVGDLVYQERYSGKDGVDEWRTVDFETFQRYADQPLTERRVLKVIEHDKKSAGPFVASAK